jgi:hypothetical protein
MEVSMCLKNKISLIVLVLLLLTIACGQLQVGVEPINEEPPPVPPTKTAELNAPQSEVKQTNENAPLPTNTLTGNPEPTNTEVSVLPEGSRLDCSEFGTDALTTVACNVEASFISRNTQPLLSYMPPEFALGYWLSEWTTVTPEYVVDYFHNYLQPPNPDQMTFTTDPDQFPDIGRPIDTMLGPDREVGLVIYSEGWNEDGKGAVIIFITGNEVSGYQFSAMLVAGNHFEMPPGPEGPN